MRLDLAGPLPPAGFLERAKNKNSRRRRGGRGADRREAVPASIKYRMIPSAYHSQPSPPRVARIITIRNHRGARHRCTRRIRR